MKVSIDKIKAIREITGAPIIRVKTVLESVEGDESKAIKILVKEGFEKADKKKDRETRQGLIATYTHHSGKVGSMVELFCETDFVSRNEVFRNLAHELALQVASMEPKDSQDLESQEYIKDPTKKISDLIKEVISKTGENIRLGRIARLELGER